MVFRDLLIVGGIVTLAVLGHAVTIRPLYISKLNTVLQIVLIGVTLLQAGFGLASQALAVALIWVVAVDHARLRVRPMSGTQPGENRRAGAPTRTRPPVPD